VRHDDDLNETLCDRRVDERLFREYWERSTGAQGWSTSALSP
jgi:hypothetical protein